MTHTVAVTGYAADGSGVARLTDGRAVFLRGGARGDVCEISLTKERPRSCRGEILRIVTPSPYRAEPDCPLYGDCGGCDFRHVTYEEELRAKLRRVNDALERVGGLSVRADEIMSTGVISGYRNKAVFHAEERDGRTVAGFYRSGTRDIVPVGRCPLLRDELNEALREIQNRPVSDVHAPPSDGESGFYGHDGRGRFSFTLRTGRSGMRGPVEEELDGLVFQMSPRSFFQVNTDAALPLFQKAREYAALSEGETLADLYCGVGALTLFLGRDAGRALGVEREPSAVADARENARRNGIKNAGFICADAAAWPADGVKADCVSVDPPRAGLSAGAARKISELSPERIVYLSCDPATLARDIALLNGYRALRVCATDMFPRTANVECAALLERQY